ncbi:hypothetical protein [Nitrososphaera viennensis]|nr:hypothetical protein [Nitrososphaera viennensis]
MPESAATSLLDRISNQDVMVETKKLLLEAEILIDVPKDIVEDEERLDDVTQGLGKALTKGLYDQGIDFQVSRLSFRLK